MLAYITQQTFNAKQKKGCPDGQPFYFIYSLKEVVLEEGFQGLRSPSNRSLLKRK